MNEEKKQEAMENIELIKELVVQIVAIGDDNDRWVLQFRSSHKLPCVEGHQQALPRALRMPDHAGLATAIR